MKAPPKIQVTKFLFALVILNLFALPFYWGHNRYSIFTPVLWGIAIAIFGVATGWRQGGVAKSLFFGMVYACAGFLPAYFIGWLF